MIIGIYFLLIIFIGILNKVNIYESFLKGVKTGLNNVIGLYPNIFVLNLIVQLFISSNFLKLFSINEIFLQMILKPISYSGSLIIMNNIYLKYNINSIIGFLTSFIQFSSDTTLFIISIYTVGLININKSRIIKIGLLINVVGFFYSFVIANLIYRG